MPTGIERIAAERQRQVTEEGWTPDHDDHHDRDSMAKAAACYAAPVEVFALTQLRDGGVRATSIWPWETKWDKRVRPSNSGFLGADLDARIRDLEKAGALCAAEIDRLQRLKARRGLDTVSAA